VFYSFIFIFNTTWILYLSFCFFTLQIDIPRKPTVWSKVKNNISQIKIVERHSSNNDEEKDENNEFHKQFYGFQDYHDNDEG